MSNRIEQQPIQVLGTRCIPAALHLLVTWQRRIVLIHEQNNLFVARRLQQRYEYAEHRIDLGIVRHTTRNAFDMAQLTSLQIRGAQQRQQTGTLALEDATHGCGGISAAPRSRRKIKRYHRVARILISITTATRLPNLCVGEYAAVCSAVSGSFQITFEHRKVHTLAKTLGPTAECDRCLAIQHIGNKHGLIDKYTVINCLGEVMCSDRPNHIIRMVDQP